MQRWEYLRVTTWPRSGTSGQDWTYRADDGQAYELDLNRLGHDGWELVTSFGNTEVITRTQGRAVQANTVWLVFKRPLED